MSNKYNKKLVIDYGDTLFLPKPFSSEEGIFMFLFGFGILVICWQWFDDIWFIVGSVISLFIASIVAIKYIKKCRDRGIYFRDDSIELVFLPAWKYDHGYHLIFKKDITDIKHEKYGSFICIEFEHDQKKLSMKYRINDKVVTTTPIINVWLNCATIAELRRELLLQEYILESAI